MFKHPFSRERVLACVTAWGFARPGLIAHYLGALSSAPPPPDQLEQIPPWKRLFISEAKSAIAHALAHLCEEKRVQYIGRARVPHTHLLAGNWYVPGPKPPPKEDYQGPPHRHMRLTPVTNDLRPNGFRAVTSAGFWLPTHETFIHTAIAWLLTRLPWPSTAIPEYILRRQWHWFDKRPLRVGEGTMTRVCDAVIQEKDYPNHKNLNRDFRVELELNIKGPNHYTEVINRSRDGMPILFIAMNESDAARLSVNLKPHRHAFGCLFAQNDSLLPFLECVNQIGHDVHG